MIIALMQIELSIPASTSLKNKRMVVRSIIDRIKHRFNVSISEIDDQDIWKTAIIAIACVGTDAEYVDTVLNNVITLIRQNPNVILIDYCQEHL